MGAPQVDQPQPPTSPTVPPANLLDMDEKPSEKVQPVQPVKPSSSLLDLDSEPAPQRFQTSVSPQTEQPQSSVFSTSINQNNLNEGSYVNFIQGAPAFKNIVVPYVPVIDESDSSR